MSVPQASQYVIPKEGKKVRDPRTGKHILDSGQYVTGNRSFWAKRKVEGAIDIKKTKPNKSSKKSNSETKTEKSDNKR